MKKQNKSVESVDVFFALVRAGLWEKSIQLLPYGKIDFSLVQALAEEQSVVGLVAAGLEHVSDTKVPKKDVIQFIGQTLQMEEHNKAMNYFIGVLVDKMREAGIYTLLVKGQGIAQCYEKPLWRACGDVDFFMDAANYKKAKSFLTPLSSSIEPEGEASLHYGMTIDPWVVELHGTLHCGLSSKMDKLIDLLQKDTFTKGQVRVWRNGETDIFLPSVDNDLIFIFTHFIKHFYKGGIGLRQICDWCRLLWTYREQIDTVLLKNRLRLMGLMTEWKAFAAFAVNHLGMVADAMPFYDDSKKWNKKARHIREFVLESGNFGNNRESGSLSKYPYLIRKICSMGVRIGDLAHHARIFPWDSLRFFPAIMFNGIRSAIRGE